MDYTPGSNRESVRVKYLSSNGVSVIESSAFSSVLIIGMVNIGDKAQRDRSRKSEGNGVTGWMGPGVDRSMISEGNGVSAWMGPGVHWWIGSGVEISRLSEGNVLVGWMCPGVDGWIGSSGFSCCGVEYMTSIDTKEGTDVIETEAGDNEIGSVAETGLTAISDINK